MSKISLYFRNRPALESSVKQPTVTTLTEFHKGAQKESEKSPNTESESLCLI